MLDFLRKRKRSWIIVFFLFVIIVVFIAFYGGNPTQDLGFRDVATVNGEVLTQREFALHYSRLLDRYRELFKGSMTPELIKSLNLKNNLLDELITQKLIVQQARALGVSVTDDELAERIAQVPEFQVNGRFNKERYTQILRANRLTPAQFEAEQRDQLAIERIFGIVLDSVHVTEAEVRERYRFENEKINLQFIRLAADAFLSEVKVTEEEIQKFYERNKESLKEPLRVRVAYLAYPFDRFSRGLEISDPEIEQYYNANRETKFHTPKQARLRYVFLRAVPGAGARHRDSVRERANQIAADARAGKDFSRLAREHSQDPSAARGGDIGWVTQGQLPASFDGAVFALGKGGITNPIETSDGMHIFKVEDVREAKTLNLKEATPEIIRLLRAEKAKSEAAKAAETDRQRAAAGADLAQVAKESEATHGVTPWLASGDVAPEIGAAPEFYKAALGLGVGEVSQPVETANAYYVLKLKDRKEPVVPPLEAVRPRVEKALKESKANERLVQRANEILAQLKKETDLDKVARANGLTAEETGWFARNSGEIPKIGELPELTAGGIALSPNRPIAERVFTQNGAAFVLAFKGSQGADMERFEREKDSIMKEALAEVQQRVLERFKDGLKAKAKVEIHSGALEEV